MQQLSTIQNKFNDVSSKAQEQPKLTAALATLSVVGLYAARLAYQNWHASDKSQQNLKVVVTGASKGLGKATARKFLECGDDVVICSRSQERVDEAVAELSGISATAKVFGIACNVAKPEQIDQLVQFAFEKLGEIDVWVNNAGITDGGQPLWETEVDVIQNVASVNLLGTFYTTRQLILSAQSRTSTGKKIHIFNTAGMGTDGEATGNVAMYGASKRSYLQFADTINAELKEAELDDKVAVHTYSPGMIVTPMLESLMGKYLAKTKSTSASIKIVNAVSASGNEVAEAMVPKMRHICVNGASGSQYPKFLTFPGILWCFAKAGLGLETKYFDGEGRVRDEFRVDW